MKDHKAVIKQLRKHLEDGNLIGTATRKAGIKSPDTLFQWKKKSHFNRLGILIEAARERGQGKRDDMVEDAQFKRLVEGKASGSEYEFYLINRRADRWKKEFQFTGPAGVPLLKAPPTINYISVPVTVVHTSAETNGHDTNGHALNGHNGRLAHE